MNRTEYAAKRRTQHAAALATLHADPVTADGAAMFRKLRRIECRASRGAVDYCNGVMRAEAWEAFKDKIRASVAQAFGGKLPAAFYLNGDPRGYALKLDPERGPVPEGLETDWGRYGIIAPPLMSL